MSASAQTRARAFLSMVSPLGPDKLIPTRFRAEEAISTPFLFAVEMVAEDAGIRADDLLNTAVGVTLRDTDGTIREFNGIVRHFLSTGPARRNHWGYAAEIVPRLWFLSQTEDCRTFENKTAQEIIGQLFNDAGLQDFDFRLSTPPKPREYTVQYDETDLAFASRLIEEEGWFYFFEHTASAHKLIITDANTSFVLIRDLTFKFDPAGVDSRECVTLWRDGLATAYGAVRLTDYDPAHPSTSLDFKQNTTFRTGGATMRDVFHWRARTTHSELVEARARYRIEAAEAVADLKDGSTSFAGFFAGARFSLVPQPTVDGSRSDFVVQGITHEATDDSWLAAGALPPTYSNQFRAFPATRAWREPMRTPRPHMSGVYSGQVIGPESEEIYTDRLGRVKVRFKWDHRPTATDGGALWLRVVQPWAGNGWGSQFLPRVGTEVAVAFMDGDPDRPVVIGGLYNGDQLPPFALPDSRTVSGLRTRSSRGGGRADYSELSFDDAKGKELVLLHAQKDLRIEVENDQTLTVDHCRVKTVKQDETVSIGQNQSIKIGKDRTTAITGNDSLKLDTGNRAVALSLGNLSWKADLGAISGEAMQSIELKVGANSVKIDQSGVTISGIMIKLSGQAMVDVNAPMTSVKADGILILNGGLVMLN